MDTNEINADPVNTPKRVWRRHSAEFKARVIELASQPHASVAGVALANGINANMLRNWVRTASAEKFKASSSTCSGKDKTLAFVQLPVQVAQARPSPAPSPVAAVAPPPTPTPTIDVQIHRNETRVVVSLPMSVGSASWLREVLG